MGRKRTSKRLVSGKKSYRKKSRSRRRRRSGSRKRRRGSRKRSRKSTKSKSRKPCKSRRKSKRREDTIEKYWEREAKRAKKQKKLSLTYPVEKYSYPSHPIVQKIVANVPPPRTPRRRKKPYWLRYGPIALATMLATTGLGSYMKKGIVQKAESPASVAPFFPQPTFHSKEMETDNVHGGIKIDPVHELMINSILSIKPLPQVDGRRNDIENERVIGDIGRVLFGNEENLEKRKVKKIYRKLMTYIHPDKYKGNKARSQEASILINNAKDWAMKKAK